MAMIEELLNAHTDEIWKPVVVRTKIIPGYAVSNHGRITGKKGQFMSVLPRKRHERDDSSRISLQVPKDLFPDYEYKPRKGEENSKFRRITYAMHQLVMGAFDPIDNNPPISKEDWEQTPESAKEIIRYSMVIDHIDNNPFNNHINNLQRVLPRDNNSNVKKHKLNDTSRSGSDNSLV
jgi:hypothetical protein